MQSLGRRAHATQPCTPCLHPQRFDALHNLVAQQSGLDFALGFDEGGDLVGFAGARPAGECLADHGLAVGGEAGGGYQAFDALLCDLFA